METTQQQKTWTQLWIKQTKQINGEKHEQKQLTQQQKPWKQQIWGITIPKDTIFQHEKIKLMTTLFI